MLRVILLNMAIFLVPFILYGAYMILVRRHQDKNSLWRDAPILWLFSAGLVLVLFVVFTLISFERQEPGGVYHPPVYKDGKIQPGYIEREKKAEE